MRRPVQHNKPIVYYQNVRSICNKLQSFYVNSSLYDYDIIAITETWLQDKICNSEIIDCNLYTVYRKDRNFGATQLSRGGGVLLAFKSNLKIETIDTSEILILIPHIDIVGCKCKLRQDISLSIFVIYIPRSPSSLVLNILLNFFENNCVNSNHLLIIGDFNIPDFNSGNLNENINSLINFSNFMNLSQVNRVVNSNNRLLDLAFTNIQSHVTRDDFPLVDEDAHHPALSIELNLDLCYVNFPSLQSKQYNFRRANYPQLYNNLIEVDWSYLRNFTDVHSICDAFYGGINDVLDKHVPLFKRRNSKYPPWFDSEIISNIKLKAKYFNKFKNTNCNDFYRRFIDLRRLIKNQIKTKYKAYLTEVEQSVISNPRTFWSFINNLRKSSRIPGNMHLGGTKCESPQEIVDTFSNHFKSVYSDYTSSLYDYDFELSNTSCIDLVEINEYDVLTSIKSLKGGRTSGPDQIPAFLVKDCAAVFSEPLMIIFNTILKTGCFPSSWKLSKVCPVYKNGSPNDISNYRAVSLLSNFAKIFEILLQNKIYFQIKSCLSPLQHGFIEKRSTISNLFCFTQRAAEILDRNSQVDVIYTDFTKAFDRLDHRLLIHKLRLFGFSDRLCNILQSYLYQRRQYVEYNGYKSEEARVTSGVPQGSNLGPLLFLLFINDLPNLLDCECLLFADDVKLFLEIKTESCCTRLQHNLNLVLDWCKRNSLSLNIQKCKAMTYTRKKSPVLFNYSIDGVELEKVRLIKDLGIYFDEELTFNEHIDVTIRSANKMLGFIIRSSKDFSNILLMKQLYYAFVRSKLEYGSLIWSPYYECGKISLENVQRKFLKYVWFKSRGHYPVIGIDHSELLAESNIALLDVRRKVISIQFLYKLLNNMIDCAWILSRINFLVPRYASRCSYLLQAPYPKTNLMLKSPLFVMITNYNKISHMCDIFNISLKQIKNLSVNDF